MERWCVVDPEGRELPEPIGDSEIDVIECFCALSETAWESFKQDGYTTRQLPTLN